MSHCAGNKSRRDSDPPRMDSILPLPLPQDVLLEIVAKAKDWALMHGAGMRSKANFSVDSLQFAPFVLLPSPFPRSEFEKSVRIQPILNELIHRVAHDGAFLRECLQNTIQVDDFTGRLFQIYETVQKEGVAQPLSLGLVRSDLMLESTCISTERNELEDENQGTVCSGGCPLRPSRSSPYCCWKQVEVNTIASGFGWLGPASAAIQRYILSELGHTDMLINLPENNALQGLCGGMIEAWRMYNQPSSVIMFIIEDQTFNICDQRFHEFEIRKLEPAVRVIRRTLTQVADTGRLGPNKELMVGREHVAVVYFRAGYEPGHYHSQREWDARLLIERSRAIKCPSIHYHLAGTKKVQQALARPGVVERFLQDSQRADAVKEIFTGLYSLDFDEYGDQAVQMALENPDKFVLKPQREGGGNNVYGEEVAVAIKNMKNSKERTAWILMERINPPLQANYIVRPGGPETPEIVDVVSELGIFGVVIGDEKQISINRQVGHMLRTKVSTANEGGVAAGLGALDSPYLVDL